LKAWTCRPRHPWTKARVPREVSFHPLRAEIVTIHPDWRGYEFVLVNEQIVGD
jgi:hypothetical protein